MTLTLYTNPMSRGRIARWALEEVGAPYETEVVAYGPVMKAPEYLAINPMGKVPALVHDGVVVTETAAIVAYLADAFPQAGLAPAGALRGPYYRWMFFAAGCLEAAMLNKALGVVVPPERSAMVGYGNLGAVLEALEGAVAGSDYILGKEFSAADIYVGSQLGFGLRFGMVEKRPVFAAYLERICARPAWVRANELDDALMPPAG